MNRINYEQSSMVVQPTFLIGTYDENDVPNFTPITWLSVTYDTDHFSLVVSMSDDKKARRNIARSGVFSANLVSTDMLEMLDYFGSRSGLNGAKDGYTYERGEGNKLHVPTLEKSRFVYECEVSQTINLPDVYREAGGVTMICAIKNVQVADYIDMDGIDLTKLDPVVYSGHYHSIGAHLGKIGDFYKEEK